MVPAADTAYFRIETGGQRASRFDDHVPIRGILRQTITGAKAAEDLEAHVMRRSIGLFPFHCSSVGERTLSPFFLMGKPIQHPKFTRKETAGPIPGGH